VNRNALMGGWLIVNGSKHINGSVVVNVDG